MNKSAIAAAIFGLCAASAASAQNVTLYGLLDTGIEYLNHTGPNGASQVRMPNITGSVPSRFGLRGGEDLGNGWKATFVLESGIALDSGALNYGGRLFGRQANVALAGPWGILTLGRQYTMTFHALLDTDTLGPNVYAISNLDPYLPNTRADNAVGWLGHAGAFSYGATWSSGRDAAGPAGPQATNCAGESSTDRLACRQATVMAKYSAERFGVAASWDRMRGGPNALFGLNSGRYSDTRTTLGAYVKAGNVKFTGGILHRENLSANSFESNLFHAGVTVALDARWTLDGQVGKLAVNASPNDATIVAVRATYAFSRRTVAYLSAGHIANGGTSAIAVSPGATTLAGMDQSGVMAGLRLAF
ncbi:porin [Massilia putida]|uniref:porin n=1 Tax=Massilia putida TaxID=1141883 RepID=UPI0009532254|nr:porin [Massilia putida]